MARPTIGKPELERESRDAEPHVAGKAYPRLEGPQKVSGRAVYSSDVRLPGLLYARVLRSPLPHARIRRIDVSRAEGLPSVHAVITAASAPSIPWYSDSYLFDRTVRFIGDEVAAVAAESEDIAEDALRLIEIDYEPLSFVVDLEAALGLEAPRVWPSYRRGDSEAGFRDADVVIDRTYTTQAAVHNALEPHGCTARWDGDHLTLWSSTQSVFQVRQTVAESLGLKQDRVRVIMEHMGGGFGAKQVAWKHDVIAALLSQRSGRPVQLMLDREAENLAVGNRNPTRQRVRLGAWRDGTLTAIEAHLQQGIGAYLVGGEGSDVPGLYQTMYRCANVLTEQTLIYTNTGPAVAFRAPGFVEAAFALESAMDELARELGIDPLELRLRNYTDLDQLRGKPYTTQGLRECYARASEVFGWREHKRLPTLGSKRRGIGMAANVWAGGAGHPPAYAWVKLNEDGTADVITGTQDIGTGTRTGLAQIAAEELGLPLDQVSVHLGDTERGPYAPVSAGSATQASLGPAIKQAAADARRRIVEAAASLLSANSDDLFVEHGRVRTARGDGPQMRVEEVCRRISPNMIQGFGHRGPNPRDKSVRTFAAQFAEIEIDVETGEVSILRIVSSNDCGRIVNPTLVESQVTGGITQGAGFALAEERVIDQSLGAVLNAGLEEYKIPTALDAPTVTHAPVDLPDFEANPTGAKGIGEPPLVATAPAIANAIFDAAGVRLRDLPLSRWRLLDALKRDRKEQ
jgi:CO/xanthine dehydrogenase Mo-binding subunit